MKKMVFFLLVIFIHLSCSSDNCISEKQKESEKYDKMIEAANDDPAQRDVLIRNKEIRLAQFDC